MPRLTSLFCVAGLSVATALPHAANAEEWDPIEPANRVFFAVNDGLDFILIKPLARGWIFVIREPGANAVDRFFTNLEFPIRFVGNLLQARWGDCGEETARFLVNSTVGIVGFFDLATGMGLDLNDEDIGQAVGTWGVGAGPYLMVPLLGPSNGRDFFTGFADSALLGPVSIVRSTVGNLNTRALLLDEVEEAKLASLDYYAFVRNAYVTTRQAQIEDRDPDRVLEDEGDDLYEIDEELEEGIEEEDEDPPEDDGESAYGAVAKANVATGDAEQ